MPAKKRPLPDTLEASHARIRTLEATLRQRLDPPCYVRYLVGRLVPQVGATDVAEAVGRGLDTDTIGRWIRGGSVAREWHTRKVIHRLEMRLWEVTIATEKRGGESREQDSKDDTFRGEVFELHETGKMEDVLTWLADFAEDSAITASMRRAPSAPAPATAAATSAPAPAAVTTTPPPRRRAHRARAETRRRQLPFRFFELQEMRL